MGETDHSQSVVSSSQGLFASVRKDGTWTKCWNYVCEPSEAITQSRLVFNVPRLDSDNFCFLQDMRLFLNVKLQDKDGNAVDKNESFAPICDFGNALFSSVKLFLNETQVSSGNNGLYHYQSYIRNLTNNSSDRKKGILQAQGYYEDSAGKTGNGWRKMIEDHDQGWFRRRGLFGVFRQSGGSEGTDIFIYDGRSADVVSDLCTDFKAQNAPLLNGVAIRLELLRNAPGFCIQSNYDKKAEGLNKGIRLVIERATLVVPVRTMAPSLSANLEKLLSQKPQEYHTMRTDIRKITLAKGQSDFTIDNLKQSAISPDRLMVAIIAGQFCNDPYGVSPFYFTNYVPGGMEADGKDAEADRAYLTSMRLLLNNESLENVDMSEDSSRLALRQFLLLYESLGYNNSETACEIDLKSFPEGFFLVLYDLTASKRAALSGPVRQEARQGALKLQLHFSKALPQTSYLLVLGEYHTKVVIDKNRNVSYRFLD